MQLEQQNIDLHSLKLFVLVCESGSIGQAAKQSNIATSAVSKRISDLEQQLRVNLLIRHNRGIKPTFAGEYLLRHAKTIVSQLNNLQKELSQLNKNITGYVRLHANNSVISHFLANDLTTFIQQQQDININLIEQISPLVIQDVISGIADIGICSYSSIRKEQLKQIQTKFYACDTLVLLIPKQHPLYQQQDIKFSQALDYEFISFNSNTSIGYLTKQAANNIGKPLKSQFELTNPSILLQLVSKGIGIGIVPNHIAQQIDNSLVKKVALTETWAQRQFHIISKDFTNLTPASSKLVQHLLKFNN